MYLILYSIVDNRKIVHLTLEKFLGKIYSTCQDLETHIGSQAFCPCRNAPEELGDSISLMICDSDSNPDDFVQLRNSMKFHEIPISLVLWSFNHARGQPFPLRMQQIDLKIIENQDQKLGPKNS